MLRLYIDESGCTGFRFANGSSEWFVVGGFVIRDRNEAQLINEVRVLRESLRFQKLQPLHFTKQTPQQRAIILDQVSRMPIKAILTAFHKPSLLGRFSQSREQMFHYGLRLCFERFSWICREHGPNTIGDITISQRKQFTQADFVAYMHLLKAMQTQIDWRFICPTRISVVSHRKSASLQISDYITSAARFSASIPGENYLARIENTLYRRGQNLLSYGFKILPPYPQLKGTGLLIETLPLFRNL